MLLTQTMFQRASEALQGLQPPLRPEEYSNLSEALRHRLFKRPKSLPAHELEEVKL